MEHLHPLLFITDDQRRSLQYSVLRNILAVKSKSTQPFGQSIPGSLFINTDVCGWMMHIQDLRTRPADSAPVEEPG